MGFVLGKAPPPEYERHCRDGDVERQRRAPAAETDQQAAQRGPITAMVCVEIARTVSTPAGLSLPVRSASSRISRIAAGIAGAGAEAEDDPGDDQHRQVRRQRCRSRPRARPGRWPAGTAAAGRRRRSAGRPPAARPRSPGTAPRSATPSPTRGSPNATPIGTSATEMIVELIGFSTAPEISGASSLRSNPAEPSAHHSLGYRASLTVVCASLFDHPLQQGQRLVDHGRSASVNRCSKAWASHSSREARAPCAYARPASVRKMQLPAAVVGVGLAADQAPLLQRRHRLAAIDCGRTRSAPAS